MNGISPESVLLRFAASTPAIRGILVATVMIGLSGLAAAAARRASASTRHAIWLLGLGAALAAAGVSAAGPFIDIHTTTVVNGPGVVPMDIGAWMDAVPRRGDLVTPSPVPRVTESRAATRWIVDHRGMLVVALWLAGLMLIVGRSIAGHLGVARLIARSHPFDRARVARNTTLPFATRSEVGVRVSPDVEAPCTVGALRPVVLLPLSASAWSDERIRIVLVHELAHVVRLDYVAQIVATAACAVYWFNPIVWLAASRLRAEAEQAADDRVLAAGVDGVTYASHLLELARPERDADVAAVAVGMAHSTRLERRFHAMLDSTRSRGIVPLRLQALGGLAVMAIAVPVAGFRLVTDVQAATPAVSTPHVAPPATRAALSASRPSAHASAPVIATASATTVPAAESPTTRTAFTTSPDSTFEKTVAASPGERLTIDIPVGGELVIQAWNQPQARLRATLSGDQSRMTRVDFERDGRGVALRADFDRRIENTRNSNRFELWLPRRFDVSIRSAGGGVSITGMEGTFTGSTGGGEIHIEGVKGEARLSTGGGSLYLNGSNLEGSVTTGGGEATVTAVSGGVRVSSGSGPVIRSSGSTRAIGIGGNAVAVGGGQNATTIGDRLYDGSFSMQKAGGDIRLDAMPTGGSVSTGGGDVVIGSSGGQLSASTGGGRIEIDRMGGNVVATTGAGDVTIDVVNGDGTAHSIQVHSGTGRVILELPANIDARFDLETAYTENHSVTSIKSDFPVQLTETTDWDDRNGTPRKFVRASGSAGSGRGLIRIRTVNGDVIIRRK